MSATNSDWQAVCRRAGGRRAYNSRRRFQLLLRLRQVVTLLDQYGMERGYQARIAEELDVSPATVCRDIARLRPRPGRNPDAERTARTNACLDRRARLEALATGDCGVEPHQPSPPNINVPATPSGVSANLQYPRWLSSQRATNHGVHRCVVGTRRRPTVHGSIHGQQN